MEVQRPDARRRVHYPRFWTALRQGIGLGSLIPMRERAEEETVVAPSRGNPPTRSRSDSSYVMNRWIASSAWSCIAASRKSGTISA